MSRVRVYLVQFGDRPALQMRWTDPSTGKLRTESTKTDDPKKAEQARADKEYELNNGLHAEPSKMTWERFRELFEQEHLAGLRPGTQEKFEGVLNVFERTMKPKRLADIDGRKLSRYVVALREDKARPATIAAHLRHLRVALRWAAAQKFIRECPTIPKVHVQDELPHRISDEDFQKLLEHAPDDLWQAFLRAAWYTGLRRNELLALTWFDVDFEGMRLTVHAATSKGRRTDWVPLHPEIAPLLKALPQTDAKVFPLGIRPDHLTHRFAKLAKAAGVDCSLHDLRRSFASRLAPHVPAQVLMRLCRHRSISVTMRYYANLEDGLHDAIAKVS